MSESTAFFDSRSADARSNLEKLILFFLLSAWLRTLDTCSRVDGAQMLAFRADGSW